MGEGDLSKHFNFTYIIKNYETKEFFVEFLRPSEGSVSTDNVNPFGPEFKVFTDNSAFNLERKHNKTYTVGSNTYPYINGLIWEPNGDEGNAITIVTNRPGGVTLKTPRHDILDFYLTRKLDNVNMDKGLPNRLEDTAETRAEFIINLDNRRGWAQESMKRLTDLVNDPIVVIEP